MSSVALATPEAPEATRPTRLVLIEDNVEYARLVRELLRDAWPARFDIDHFERLSDAHAQLQAGEADCVLLDLGLVDASGLEAVAKVKQLAPKLPVVVLTGHDDEAIAVRAVKAGAQDYLVKGRTDGSLIARAVRYAIERKGAELELAHQALHDSLTELPNRALFLDRLEQALVRTQRNPSPVAVLFLDIDSFKLINDSLGHDAGDQLLVELAGRLAGVVRPSDTVARFGGDEFTILCDHVNSSYDVIAIANRVAEAVALPFTVGGHEVFVTSSVGIAFAKGERDDPALLVRNADAAMYRAKEKGGARYEVFDQLMRARATKRLELQSDLHRALQRGELRLEYQPEVDLRSGAVVGVEALLRWDHPVRGMLPAGEFIALAEQTGLIGPIGTWVIEEACERLHSWEQELSGSTPTVAVNISPRELAEPDLLHSVRAALASSGASPERLCLEITERGAMEDAESVVRTLSALKRLGVQLAIDDFGVGQSSLGYLSRFPVDVLKIDRSLMEGLGPDADCKRLVASVVGLAGSLGLASVAEGVEREEQRQELVELDCDLGQGYHLARPMPPDELEPLLAAAQRP
jgi:diguanylate cyclase (GGDEF)-like protein